MDGAHGIRVAEVNVAVADVGQARRFYADAFGFDVVTDSHGDGHEHLQVVFGSWPGDRFFLLNLVDADGEPDRVGRASLGLLVPDLDAAHRRALAAGAGEICPPDDVPGMPRCSGVRDPSGNEIYLYQDAVPGAGG